MRGVGAFFALEFVSDRQTREPLVPWQGKSMGVMPTLFGGLRKRGVYAFGRYNFDPHRAAADHRGGGARRGAAALDRAVGELQAAAGR